VGLGELDNEADFGDAIMRAMNDLMQQNGNAPENAGELAANLEGLFGDDDDDDDDNDVGVHDSSLIRFLNINLANLFVIQNDDDDDDDEDEDTGTYFIVGDDDDDDD